MYNSDMFAGAILWFAVICAVIGGALVGVAFWLIPWLWNLIKPWLHTVTA